MGIYGRLFCQVLYKRRMGRKFAMYLGGQWGVRKGY